MNFNMPISKLSETLKLILYFDTIQPVLNERAIFSDETALYKNPIEPREYDQTKVILRTEKGNADNVLLHFGSNTVEMKVARTDELFDFYEGVIPATKVTVGYYFEIRLGRVAVFYNKKGVLREPNNYYNFKIIPNFKTPDWAKGAIMYQIFVDRFYNGDRTNDVLTREYMYVNKAVEGVTDWNKLPDKEGIREFYGGDLQGVIDKMDYLTELGVEVIYLNPIFVSPSNHKYDTQDYDNIDPHFGKIIFDEGSVLADDDKDNTNATKYISRVTDKRNLDASNELLIELVEKAHSRGMHVILDGVFNHCGSFNKWLDREMLYSKGLGYEKGAYIDKTSPYTTFFRFMNQDGWPNNGRYDGWWGYDTLPKLNYEGSPKLYEYIMKVAKKWVSPPYNIDGWRLDVAADLGYTKEFNHQFWRDFRKAVKAANPQAVILAEHYGDPGDWLLGDQWDTVMNYDAFMEPVTWFLTGMQKHSDEFRSDLLGNYRAFFDAMTHHMSRFNGPSLLIAMNELSNHDHSRFLTRTNHKVGRLQTLGSAAAEENINFGILKAAVAMQMTWPGAPTIYYGDEVGLSGWTDPDNRRTFPWGNENKEVLNFHKAVISLHKSFKVFRTGSLKYLKGEPMVIAYGRFDEKDQFVIAVNASWEERKLIIPVWEIGIGQGTTLKQMLLSNSHSHTKGGPSYSVKNGKIEILLPPFGSMILKNQ